MNHAKKLFLCAVFLLIFHSSAFAEVWKITSYCDCKSCCGPGAKGITASGKKVSYGMVACNWLPFGTKLHIANLGDFVVQDRGAKSLFGSKKNHIRHLDVFLPNHKQALQFGVKYLDVKIEGR